MEVIEKRGTRGERGRGERKRGTIPFHSLDQLNFYVENQIRVS
jgi:hypothetical protein